jgi:hypothetical protein
MMTKENLFKKELEEYNQAYGKEKSELLQRINDQEKQNSQL